MAEGRLSHPIDDSAERACRASQMFSAGLPTLIMSFTRLTLALRKLWLGMSCGWPVEPAGTHQDLRCRKYCVSGYNRGILLPVRCSFRQYFVTELGLPNDI